MSVVNELLIKSLRHALVLRRDLGGTIHDVAQVVGAGYAVSEPVGNVAVIVKLFRVFLLLPVVLAIGYCASMGCEAERKPWRRGGAASRDELADTQQKQPVPQWDSVPSFAES